MVHPQVQGLEYWHRGEHVPKEVVLGCYIAGNSVLAFVCILLGASLAMDGLVGKPSACVAPVGEAQKTSGLVP